MKYQLKSKNYNEEPSELVLDNLLRDRGIEDPAKWLHPSKDYEYSPFLMHDMKKAVDIIHETLKKQEANILVVVDSDTDGYTSGAIIYSLLGQICFKHNVDYVLHPGKEHGIDLKDIPEDIDLLIVPDAGTSQKEEHLKLLERGTKIIIADHHTIPDDLEYGDYQNDIAIINSHIDYPNPDLSGAGVALKLVQGYCATYGLQYPMRLYGLAACGIVADVMDMTSLENKYIVDKGLQYINEHAFLKAMIDKAHYNLENPEPSLKDIGWVIGPNINSIIRLGTMPQKHTVFQALVNPTRMVLSTKKGEEDTEVQLFEEALRLCENAKKRQTTAVNSSMKIIEQETDCEDRSAIIYIDENQELTFELSGLIANKLLSKYNKPTILLRNYTTDKIKEYRGSIRSKPVEGMPSFKDALEGITGVDFVAGHDNAAGIGINQDAIAEFKSHLYSILDDLDFNSNLYIVDLISDYDKLNIENARIMGRDDIWGHGVDKPQVVINNAPIDKYELMGKEQEHLKIDCGKYDIVLFNVPELTKKLLNGEKYDINIIGEFDIDKAYNIGRLQCIANDYELSEFTPRNPMMDLVF